MGLFASLVHYQRLAPCRSIPVRNRRQSKDCTVNQPMIHTRRLPVYLLLDCSGSMVGEPIAAINTGLQAFVSAMNEDPQALETVWVSVIAFSSVAEQVTPLMDVVEFRPPSLEPEGATALGEALEVLQECIAAEVRHTTAEQKGDWRPMAFLFTDGEPTDNWRDAAKAFRESNHATLIACGAGPEIKDATLHALSDTVVHLKDTHPGTLISFMQWVTQAVTTASQSLGRRPDADADYEYDLPSGEGLNSP